ncbi:histidine kinase [Microbacterium sp. PA5]|uniref:sensor histidine kinase n=1 Tax=Microbacterium sp. PA5 TaxID=3416654 RepID=UPI003CEF4AD2
MPTPDPSPSSPAGPPARSVVRDPAVTRILGNTRASVLFALTVFVATAVQVLSTPLAAFAEGIEEWPFALSRPAVIALLVLGCAAQAAVLGVADRFPQTAVAVVAAIHLSLALGLAAPTWLTGMYLVIALALFLLATRRSAALAVTWLAITSLTILGGLLALVISLGTSPGVAVLWLSAEAASLVAPSAAATTLGIWWAGRVRRMRAAREEADRARDEHEARVAEAQRQERARIAQELHDVAGQHLAGLITLADAALAIAPGRPEQALQLVEEVRDEGRFAAASLAGALADLRATSPDSAASVPDLRALDGLVAYWRDRGMPVELRQQGALHDLPAVVSTTAYRCVQEALTNAARHAPGAPVDVEVAVAGHALRATVVNGPTAAGDPIPGIGLGWGLPAITERIELLQGTLSTRALDSGGWHLRFDIPLSAAG